MSRPYRMDRNSLICAVDWLADGCSMEAIVAHMKDRDTWPSVRDDYEGI
jgi:hypothetical protein